MKKWWLVISVVVVVAMLGAGALAAFHGNQQGEDYAYGAEAGVDVADELNGDVVGVGDGDVADKLVPYPASELAFHITIGNPEHIEAYEKLVEAISYLNAQGIPVVDFCRIHNAPGPDTSISQVMIVLAGLREVRDEYKEPIKAIVEGIEGIEFEFFQAEFARKEIWGWQDKIWETFSRPWYLPPGIIEVPVSGTSSSWRCQEIRVCIAGEIQPQYIEAVRALVGDKAPLHFQDRGRVPHHTLYWGEMYVPDEAREKHDILTTVLAQLFPELDLPGMRIGEVEEFFKALTPDKMTQFIRVFFDYAVEQGLVMPEERQGLEEEMLQEWLEWREE